MAVTWAEVLGWRMRRQLLDPVGTGSVTDVVERLGAGARLAGPGHGAGDRGPSYRRTAGDAARALAAKEVVKVYAFRGATHLMTPQDAGAYLAVRASSRMWELPSWESFYRLAPEDWPRFREYVRGALPTGRSPSRSSPPRSAGAAATGTCAASSTRATRRCSNR